MSDTVKLDPILDQFSMITRPYTRLNGLKTIPFPAAHTRIANIWENPPGRFEDHRGFVIRRNDTCQRIIDENWMNI